MNIEQVEQEIAEYLRAKLLPLDIDVIAIPQIEDEYQKPFDKPKVTVAWSGEKGEPYNGLGAINQRVTVRWGFHIQASKLRGEREVYAIAEEVKRCMIGYRPTDCDQLYYVSHDPDDYSDNTWAHLVVLECKTTRVEYQQYSPLPLLKKVDFIEK